jgi:hypothetical protein
MGMSHFGRKPQMSNMFAEAAERMKARQREPNRNEAQQRAERSQVTAEVSNDLTEYLGEIGQAENFELSHQNDTVALRKKASGNLLRISCTDKDNFNLQGEGAFNTTPLPKEKMADAVLEWVMRFAST